MPDWLNQNEPPSINLRSSSGFQWGQWAGDGESPGLAPLEPQHHEITGCWSPLSLSGCVTAGIQQADVIHTGPSLWLGGWSCRAMLCSSRTCGGAQEPCSSKICAFANTWITPNNTQPQTGSQGEGTPKLHSKHFQVVRSSSKAAILGCLYQLNLPCL